jgi:1,4-dihydroxy-2-naphthoate octaprenyltransferase
VNSRARALWLTARPKTLSAAVIPVLVGTALVSGLGGHPQIWIAGFALLSAIMIQIGTNYVNDAIDFWKGADTDTRLGDARAAQSGWFSPRAVMGMGIFCFAVAMAFGVPLVWEGGYPILVIGVFSLLMGYSYTGGPFPLAYLGLGDLFVILFFGLIAVGGVFFLQTKFYALPALVAGLQIGLLATVLIAINNLRDLDQDREVGKRTMAVRLGPKNARIEVLILIGLAFALNFFWLGQGFTYAFALPMACFPLALRLVRQVLMTQASRQYNQLLAQAALVHMLFGVLLSVGFILK